MMNAAVQSSGVSIPKPQPRIELYTTTYCSYCVAAKNKLRSLGYEYTEHDVTGNAEKRAWLVEMTGRRTVPQVFWDGEPIGGYTDGLLPLLDKIGH